VHLLALIAYQIVLQKCAMKVLHFFIQFKKFTEILKVEIAREESAFM